MVGWSPGGRWGRLELRSARAAPAPRPRLRTTRPDETRDETNPISGHAAHRPRPHATAAIVAQVSLSSHIERCPVRSDHAHLYFGPPCGTAFQAPSRHGNASLDLT